MPVTATSLDELAALLKQAVVPQDVFPGNPADDYRRLSKLCHPDRYPIGPTRDKAQRVFSQLSTWFAQATNDAPPSVIVSPRRCYSDLQRLASGDLADVYLALAGSTHYLLKICRAYGGNSLLVAEHRSLCAVARRGDGRSYRHYVSDLVESFVTTGDFAGRQVNVFAYRERFHTLEAIRQRHPAGLDPRHLAWLFKRMLVAAGFAQQCGFVHGGFLPPHLLVHAVNHGVQLVDWTQAVRIGRPLCFVSTRFRDWYPREVLDKESATAATDIFMAAKCLLYAAGGDPIAETWPDSVPATMRDFVNTCLYASPRMRPQNAWRLHEEFDDLLRRLFGPPKYHVLAMS